MPGPLEGVRVIDCSAYITGPYATMMLGDQGADVVKVEPRGIGDFMRLLGTGRGGISTLFAGCNRSKRSLALDLQDERGRDLLYKLVEGADVFVQNYRPGVAKRIEIDEPTLRSIRPDLVYVSITAFGPDGPLSSQPAFDHVIQALSGIAGVQGDITTGKPRFVQNAMVDKLTALTVSQAITAALLHRANTGEGQHIELSMLDAALNFLWPDGMGRDTLIGDGVDLRPPISSAYRMIDLKDGHAAVAAITTEQVHGLMRAVGRPDFIDDERFSTVNALLTNLDEFERELQGAAREMTVEEFSEAFSREDVPSSPVMQPHEVFDHPQVQNNAIVEEVDHPTMGRMRRPRPAAHFSATPANISRHAPSLSEHTTELMDELGLTEAERGDLVAKGVVG